MDMPYKILISDELRQKFVKKVEQDPDFVLILDCDKLGVSPWVNTILKQA